MGDRRIKVVPMIVAGGLGIGLIVACRKYHLIKRLKAFCGIGNPLLHHQREIIQTATDGRYKELIKALSKDTDKFPVLGFDCEWVTVDGIRRPVALLQLASHSGLCLLIRLCKLKYMPRELKCILEDENILKVGVSPNDDAKNLLKDYDVSVKSTLDLRFLAQYLNRQPEGLAKLAKTHLDLELDKNWRVRCSSWDSEELTEAQLDYAAKDCLVGIEVYKRFLEIYKKEKKGRNLKEFMLDTDCYLNKHFKYKASITIVSGAQQGLTSKSSLNVNKTSKRNLATRSKPLYDNCFLEAPDGEMLCTMDRTKAEWYQKKGLAFVVEEEPLRMRLNFEPTGRAVGQTGQYYIEPKENKCVVCGKSEECSRKFIIPKEYRKFFPIVMKSHSSHDILLLCLDCHRNSSIEDNKLRHKLAVMCQAPLICHLKKLKTFANALLTKKDMEQESRDLMLAEIKEFHPNTEITEDVLLDLSQVETKMKPGSSLGHVEKVVEHFTKTLGLLELERMWREHFLRTMDPKFLPEHWSTTHNANRLEIRADEGRIAKEDLVIAGLDPKLLVNR